MVFWYSLWSFGIFLCFGIFGPRKNLAVSQFVSINDEVECINICLLRKKDICMYDYICQPCHAESMSIIFLRFRLEGVAVHGI
jgi:hypothetical protein